MSWLRRRNISIVEARPGRSMTLSNMPAFAICAPAGPSHLHLPMVHELSLRAPSIRMMLSTCLRPPWRGLVSCGSCAQRYRTILQMVAYASCYRRYLWSRSPFTSCTHLDASFRCVCACSSISWLKRSLVFLVDDVGTAEWRLAAIVLMDCGERSNTPDMGASRTTAVITGCPLFGWATGSSRV